MDLFSSIAVLLGLAVFLDVFGVTLPVLLQVVRTLTQPFFHPGVIVLAAVGVFPSPAGIVLGLEGFFTRGTSAGLLAAAHAGLGAEGSLTVRAFLLFHPGPLSGLESYEPKEPQELEDQDEKKEKDYILPLE